MSDFSNIEDINPIINNYLSIQNIHALDPDTAQPYPVGYADFGRGGTTFLNVNKNNALLMIIEFTPEGGPRGRHKHALKYECLYILSGRLRAHYWLDDPATAVEKTHDAGTLLTIKPGLFHVYECVDGPALAVEFSPQSFDLKDHYYPE